MRDFRKLKVWEKAHRFVLAAYVETRAFPREELYGLTSQLRRSAMSIPSNIAEGCRRESPREFARFLDISAGSASEAEYQLLLAHDLHFLNEDAYNRLAHDVREIKQMLTSLIQKVKRNN